MAWALTPEWPELGFSTIAPVHDKDCLLHLASALESDSELDPRDRYFAALYLRKVAENRKALDALSRSGRGRRPGRAWNRAMHYQVCKKLYESARRAADEVARVWKVDPHSVQDDKLNAQAVQEIERLIAMRLQAPSYQPNEDGDGRHRTWTRREILKALDVELRRRAAGATRNN